MQKFKSFYSKIKINFELISNYLNTNWLTIFMLVVFLSFFKLTNHIINYLQTQEYTTIHNEIFIMSFICFITIYLVRPVVLWFLVPFLIVRLFSFQELFEKISDYFFNRSIFTHLFENIGSKDMNVIFISFFALYMIGVFLFLLTYKIIKKKWHLKSVFLLLTIVVYLITTLLFHYFLIEKNYRHILNNELAHMEKVVHSQENDFKIICNNQQYICATSKKEIMEKLNNKNFNSYIEKIPENYNVKGNFSFGQIENIYLVVQNENNWVINPELAKVTFHESGDYLMVCLDIAHSFWLFFFIWLNVFHFRRKKIYIKRIENEAITKEVEVI